MSDEKDLITRLEEIERMAENVANVDGGAGELSSNVDLPPIITQITEEPTPAPEAPAPEEPKPEAASYTEQPVIEKRASGIPLNPQVLEILEHTSGALDLIIVGIQAKAVRAGLSENTEQLGALSMVLAHVKNAKIKTDSLLG
jgi:hypothetical protein